MKKYGTIEISYYALIKHFGSKKHLQIAQKAVESQFVPHFQSSRLAQPAMIAQLFAWLYVISLVFFRLNK